MTKTIVRLLIALALAASGVALSRYAEADDSPGGVVIGWLLIVGALVFGVRAVIKRDRPG